MNRRVLPLIIGSLLLPVGCGSPTGPQPSEFCRAQGDDGIVTFEDANLEAAVRGALSIGGQDDLTYGLVSGLTELNAIDAEIASLVGIEHLTSLGSLRLGNNPITDISPLSGLTSLTFLNLGGNPITDISPLSGLTSLTDLLLLNNPITDISPLSGLINLTHLTLQFNPITDISPLSGLTSLTELRLSDNSITDIDALSGLTSLTKLNLNRNPNLSNIQPLLDNTGLGANDNVNLQGTSVSCADVAALEAKGVTVESDCP